MTDLAAFSKYLEENAAALSAWGNHISLQVCKVLEGEGHVMGNSGFLKVPPVPRIKNEASAVGKIARLGYSDPANQMTDLVGVRFVVLLKDNIDKICGIIEGDPDWNFICVRDYESEITGNPKHFDYQSVHYIVRPKNSIVIDGIEIPPKICCEVQVRTLLQHAYAEVVHDSIYKPVGLVPIKAERLVARSMALMETTDELFCQTMDLLSQENKPRNEFLSLLEAIYVERIGAGKMKSDSDLNLLVLDSYRDYISDDSIANVRGLLEKKKFIPINIGRRASESPFFCQPVSLLVYLLVENKGAAIWEKWPLGSCENEVETIFSDLGLAAR